MMETERRNNKRFRLSRMIAYDMGREHYIRASGSDISRSGMSFISEECVEPLMSIWLSFSIPETDGSWRQMEAEGYVVNVSECPEGCRFGVSFSRMDPVDRADFEAFIIRLEQEIHEPGKSAP